MDQQFEYWLTRRGVRKGTVPNRKAYLYLAYKRWVKKEFNDEVAPLRYRKWDEQMRRWGAETKVVRTRTRIYNCYMLNKWIVPKASMRDTDYYEIIPEDEIPIKFMMPAPSKR
jgi:hypothetical protein